MSFEYLDHTADVIIRAKGKNLEEAFEQAALAFYNVISDTSLVKTELTKEVTITSEDRESLLFDWIDQLIFYFDTEYLICNQIKVNSITEVENGFKLVAKISGEEFDIERHPQKTEVKAMTYSFMEISEKTVEFTIDL